MRVWGNQRNRPIGVAACIVDHGPDFWEGLKKKSKSSRGGAQGAARERPRYQRFPRMKKRRKTIRFDNPHCIVKLQTYKVARRSHKRVERQKENVTGQTGKEERNKHKNDSGEVPGPKPITREKL